MRITIPPQVNPAPMALMAITSPFLNLPAAKDSANAKGMEAAEVLP